MKTHKPNPHTIQQNKLGALSQVQQQALLRWLTVENATYETARVRLLKEFGVSTSARALSIFWQRNNVPAVSQPATDIPMSVVVQCALPVRVTVQKNGTEIRITQLPN